MHDRTLADELRAKIESKVEEGMVNDFEMHHEVARQPRLSMASCYGGLIERTCTATPS